MYLKDFQYLQEEKKKNYCSTIPPLLYWMRQTLCSITKLCIIAWLKSMIISFSSISIIRCFYKAYSAAWLKLILYFIAWRLYFLKYISMSSPQFLLWYVLNCLRNLRRVKIKFPGYLQDYRKYRAVSTEDAVFQSTWFMWRYSWTSIRRPLSSY